MKQADFDVWWRGIAALPQGPHEHAYFALRRIWADQTINSKAGARSFYRWGTEDHLTPALWQNWRLFADVNAMRPFLLAAGVRAGDLTRVQWAYACEELTGVGRSFVTPDIMVQFEDERGTGLLAIEAKKPAQPAKVEDLRKLRQYCALPSTKAIPRRYGCFLVSEAAAVATTKNTEGRHPVVTWEALAEFQTAAARLLPIEMATRDLVEYWLKRAYSREGILAAAPAPSSLAKQYGSEAAYEAVRALNLPAQIELFLLGSECVEATFKGETAAPPMLWLAEEPTLSDVSRPQFQSTADRRVCRWRSDWRIALEASHGPNRGSGRSFSAPTRPALA